MRRYLSLLLVLILLILNIYYLIENSLLRVENKKYEEAVELAIDTIEESLTINKYCEEILKRKAQREPNFLLPDMDTSPRSSPLF